MTSNIFRKPSGLSLIILLLFNACSTLPEESADAPSEALYSAAVKSSIDSLQQLLPPPYAHANTLEKTGTEPVYNTLSYLTYSQRDSAGYSCGTLMARVSYSLAFAQDDAGTLFELLLDCTDGLTTAGDSAIHSLSVRFSENQLHMDSLESLLNTIQDMFFEKQLTKEVPAGYLAGLTMEYLFLTASSLNRYPSDMLEVDSRGIIVLPLFKALETQHEAVNRSVYLYDLTSSASAEIAQALRTIQLLYGKTSLSDSLTRDQAVRLLGDSTVIQLIKSGIDFRNELTSPL